MSLPHYSQSKKPGDIIDSLDLPEGWILSCRTTTGLNARLFVRFNYLYEKDISEFGVNNFKLEEIDEEIGFPIYLDGSTINTFKDNIIEIVYSRMTQIHGKQWRHKIRESVAKPTTNNSKTNKVILLCN